MFYNTTWSCIVGVSIIAAGGKLPNFFHEFKCTNYKRKITQLVAVTAVAALGVLVVRSDQLSGRYFGGGIVAFGLGSIVDMLIEYLDALFDNPWVKVTLKPIHGITFVVPASDLNVSNELESGTLQVVPEGRLGTPNKRFTSRPILCCVIPCVQDRIGCLFADHKAGCVRVTVDDFGHDGSVGHSQTFHYVHRTS